MKQKKHITMCLISHCNCHATEELLKVKATLLTLGMLNASSLEMLVVGIFCAQEKAAKLVIGTCEEDSNYSCNEPVHL